MTTPTLPVVHYRLGPAMLACRTPGADPDSHFPASEDRAGVTCRRCLKVSAAYVAKLRALLAEVMAERNQS